VVHIPRREHIGANGSAEACSSRCPSGAEPAGVRAADLGGPSALGCAAGSFAGGG
jgi:hypothetical protein